MSKPVETSEVIEAHDTFSRQLLSEPAVAADFVQNYLPADVVALLDLSQLRIEKDTFVDARLRKHFSDVLYSVPLKSSHPPELSGVVEQPKAGKKKGKRKASPPAEERAYLYLLFEHKSQPDKGVRLQVLRYMVRIWEKEWKKKRFLSPILPIVFYHGVEVWNYSTEFAELVNVPDVLKPYTPHFQHLLTDLSSYPDELIRGEVWLRVNLLIMKHIFDNDLGQQLPKILGLMRDLVQQESGLEMLQTVLIYVSQASKLVTEEELARGVMATVTPARSDVMESLAQKWIEQGIEKGIEQGIEKGIEQGIEKGIEQGIEKGKAAAQRQTLLRLLQWRFSLTDEEQGIYARHFAQIQDVGHLTQLLDRLLTSQTLLAFEQVLLPYLPSSKAATTPSSPPPVLDSTPATAPKSPPH